MGRHRIARQFRTIEDRNRQATAPEVNGKTCSCDPASDNDHIEFCAHDRS
jgi:hypothetical protein